MANEPQAAHKRARTPALRRAQLFAGTRSRRQPRTRLRLFIARALRVVAALSIVSVIATTAAFAYLYSHYSKIVDRRLASGYLTSRAGIYAAPRVLRPGQRMTAERLSEILRRAGYVDREASRVWNGRFRTEDDAVEIRPNNTGDESSAQDFGVVRIQLDRRGQIASIDGDGVALDSYALAPEPLTIDAAEKTTDRAALSYDEIPPLLARAILSIEDRRFFEHGPVDLWGIARAAFSWGKEEQDFKQGGSTITQQLVKNTYLTPERTLRRKFREAALASVIESRIRKQDILALYCNEIYLGRRGSISVRGVRQAARVFFGKELKDLTLAEAATIAGMIQSPARYAPDRRPESARVRRNTVLAAMLRDGAITQDEARAASAEPVSVAPVEHADAVAPYFIDYASRFVESRLPPSSAESGQGLRIYTTLDLDLQKAAEESIKNQLARLEKVFKGKKRPQAALVALDPRNGRVLAMVGGDSYAESQLNRATDALRQPGSVFKPVVYAAAVEAGISPLTLSSDAPREFTYDGGSKYRPANYGGAFSMRDVTLRTGLVRSLNVVTVDAAMRTGLTRVAALAERLGLPRPQAYPSLALGTTEATPLEVATAYTAFAAGGRVARPNPLLRVEAASGMNALEEGGVSLLGEDGASSLAESGAGALEGNDASSPEGIGVSSPGGNGTSALGGNVPDFAQVLKPSTAYMLTDILSAVVDHGTARAARGAIKGVAVAGKTGTSRDGWFAGFTPNLVCVVWVGFDDGEELNLTGADSALPAWVEFVRRAVELRPDLGGQSFERPASIATVEIDPETGLLASASCPQRERVAVAPGFVPDHECSLHGDPWGLRALAEASTPAVPPSSELTATAQTTDADIRDAAQAFYAPPTRAPHATRRDAGATLFEADVGEERQAEDASRATQIIIGRDGRRRLTNDPQVFKSRADGWRE
ncbi:MAG: PBP1A family penicillin-binding protein [Acidobacteriota bacterium]|nr:PBP1A family penicillin-binding protein [Acidobacteriota bacterium]